MALVDGCGGDSLACQLCPSQCSCQAHAEVPFMLLDILYTCMQRMLLHAQHGHDMMGVHGRGSGMGTSG